MEFHRSPQKKSFFLIIWIISETCHIKFKINYISEHFVVSNEYFLLVLKATKN